MEKSPGKSPSPANAQPPPGTAAARPGASVAVLTNEAFNAGQREVLERIANGGPLPDLLERIVRLVEQQAERMFCSLLLVDMERRCVRHGAAPHLPPEYSRAIDGQPIGPNAGSCGTAAFRGERVIVEDIATHPYWANYKDFILPHGLLACWSSPIFSPTREVLGTFAMYYRAARGPTEMEIRWVDAATHLASIAIRRDQAEQALRRSEARYRQIVDTAYEGVWLIDATGRTMLVNQRMAEMLGYTREEIAGRTCFDFMEPSERPEAERRLSRRFTGVQEQFEFKLRRKDGTVLPTIIAASPVRDDDGKVVGALGMITDITERLQAEAALRAREEQLTLIHNNVSDVIFYLSVEADAQYRFLAVNHAFLKATGLKEEQIAGRLVSEVIPEPSLSLVLANYQRAIRAKETIRWDETTAYPTGIKTGEVSVTPLFDADGHCHRLIGTVHDVTERKRAEEKIREQAAMLDKAKDAILVRDLEGVVLYWNKSAERSYGWTAEEAVGRKITELIYWDTKAFDEAQAKLLEKGEWQGELPQYAKTGREITIEASWTLVRDEQGEAKFVLAINTDVTEKKQLEAQFFRAQRLDSIGTLAGGIAHDFNNILTAILGNVTLAATELSTSSPAQKRLADIEKASTRAAELVRRILTFSRQDDSRRKAMQPQPVIEEAIKLLRASINPIVEINCHFSPDTPFIFADATQLHQIVMNLCTNAAYAIGLQPGIVDVRLGPATVDAERAHSLGVRAGRYLRLVISDTGCGMDKKTLDRIFEPFFTTKAPGHGTGLGLSVVHGIVKSHGGAVTVASDRGKGTTFQIYLPACAAPAAETPTLPPESLHGHGERVLYVDDEATLVASSKELLEQLGYRVTGFTDPLLALETFRAHPQDFDVVVTDLSMPGKAGHELAGELKKIRPDIPVLMTSGSLRPEEVQHAQRVGVLELIEKPNILGALAKTLHRLFSGRRSGSSKT